MKFRIGRIAENATFSPEQSGWFRLREPAVWIVHVGGTLIGGAAAFGIGLLWVYVTRAFDFPSGPVPLADVLPAVGLGIAVFFGLIVCHELLHAAAHPGHGADPASVLGLWPAGLVAYAHYDGPMSRNRFLGLLLTPFAVLSAGPLLAALLVPIESTLLAGCSVLNALFAGGDLLGVMLICAQVPARAVVRNQGWWTWWQVPPIAESGASPKSGT